MAFRRDFLPARELALFTRNAGVRTGAYVGIALALIFTTWLYIANRVPSLEGVALQRNIAAASVFVLCAAVPVVRFLCSPGNLLVASLIAWSILSLTHRALCMHFTALAERYSTMQIFTLGAVVYMILATLSWIGTSLWRLHLSEVSHSHHESHLRHSNHHS